jgi:hypothetical protein
MIARTRLDQKGSLNAIWYEYLSVRVPLSNTKNAKPNTSVGQALLNARYYDSQRGQCLSEDPSFLALGNSNQLQQLTQQDQQKFLSDPQQLNSYSYGRGSPITNKDPNGTCIEDACIVEGAIATSPIWYPMLAATAATAAYEAGMLMRSGGGGMRMEPFDTSRLVRLPEPPSPFDFGPPDLPPGLSKWMKAAFVGTTIIGAVTDLYSAFQDEKDSLQNFLATSKPADPNSRNVQTQNAIITNHATIQKAQPGSVQTNGMVQSVLSQLSAALSRLSAVLSKSNNIK